MPKPYSEADREEFYDREWEEENYPRESRKFSHPYYGSMDELLDDPRRGQGVDRA